MADENFHSEKEDGNENIVFAEVRIVKPATYRQLGEQSLYIKGDLRVF